MAILVPTVWGSVVDFDARMQNRIVLAHRINHDFPGLMSHSFDIINIQLDYDCIVYGKDKPCRGPSEMLVEANNCCAEYDPSGPLDGSVD